MTRSPATARRRPGAMLKLARRAIRRDPALQGALDDPEVLEAAEQVISAMNAAGVLPTPLNVLHHLLDLGVPEGRAAVLAAIVEKRLTARTRTS